MDRRRSIENVNGLRSLAIPIDLPVLALMAAPVHATGKVQIIGAAGRAFMPLTLVR